MKTSSPAAPGAEAQEQAPMEEQVQQAAEEAEVDYSPEVEVAPATSATTTAANHEAEVGTEMAVQPGVDADGEVAEDAEEHASAVSAGTAKGKGGKAASAKRGGGGGRKKKA